MSPRRATTSATGRRAGFTLVEVLVVMALLAVLIAAFGGIMSRSEQAYIRSTEVLLRRLDLAIGRYRDLTGFHPPDGMDGPFLSAEGEELFYGACLYEVLGRPLIVRKVGPGGRLVVERYPSPIMHGMQERELVRDPARPHVAEFLDSWGIPIHYDRLEGGPETFSEQSGGEAHVVPSDYHPPDPRMPSFEGFSVRRAGAQNPGAYDAWSHGSPGHDTPESLGLTEEESARRVIGNWERPRGRSEP